MLTTIATNTAPPPGPIHGGACKTGKMERGSQYLYLKAPARYWSPPANLDLRTDDLYDRLVRKQNYLFFAVCLCP